MNTQERRKLAAKHPDSWIPIEPGETLAGALVDVVDAWSDVRNGGSYYPLLTVRIDSGEELKVHAFGTVLYNEVMRKRPPVGGPILITYLGSDPAKARPGQSAPEIYRVSAGNSEEVANRAYARIAAQTASPASPAASVATDVPWEGSGAAA
jgi:hypothetical protein